jgi:hypothetical protein
LRTRIKRNKRIAIVEDLKLARNKQSYLQGKKFEKMRKLKRKVFLEKKKDEIRKFKEEKLRRKEQWDDLKEAYQLHNNFKVRNIREGLIAGRCRSMNQLRRTKLDNMKLRKRERMKNYVNIFYNEEVHTIGKVNRKLESELQLAISGYKRLEHKMKKAEEIEKMIEQDQKTEDKLIQRAEFEMKGIIESNVKSLGMLNKLEYQINKPSYKPEGALEINDFSAYDQSTENIGKNQVLFIRKLRN